jgi:hypothetical protein
VSLRIGRFGHTLPKRNILLRGKKAGILAVDSRLGERNELWTDIIPTVNGEFNIFHERENI